MVEKILIQDWFYQHRVPRRIYRDQGRNFKSEVVKALCSVYGIKKLRTTMYHPGGNGQCKQFNCTMHDLLQSLLPEQKRQGPHYLQELVVAYNSTPYKLAGQRLVKAAGIIGLMVWDKPGWCIAL